MRQPYQSPEDLQQVCQTLILLGIGYLVTIGGDDTAFGASEMANSSNGPLRVVHVHKTIDNDLPLPGGWLRDREAGGYSDGAQSHKGLAYHE